MTSARGALDGARVLLGVAGGIAAYKAALVTRELRRAGADVEVMLTASARQFVGAATFAGLTGRTVRTDVFDDPADITHVRMAREADVAVFAPATANLLGKFAAGIGDDLVSSTFLCLECPVVVAPAMHAEMWAHPATTANVATLRGRGVVFVGPDEGELAGGDVGYGRLAEPSAVVDAVVAAFAGAGAGSAATLPAAEGGDAGVATVAAGEPPTPQPSALAGTRVVVTAGGTREPIDPVRFIGNRSTGKMGFALAAEARRRGARVDLVTGPTHLETPDGVTRHDVTTTEDMRTAVRGLADGASAVVKAAAVADFRPERYHDQKIKKDADDAAVIRLARNPDILAELGRASYPHGRPVLVGFAAETEDDDGAAQRKLARKAADLLVVNRVDAADAGFAVDTNKAVLLTPDGTRTTVGLMSKASLAAAVWDKVEELLAR